MNIKTEATKLIRNWRNNINNTLKFKVSTCAVDTNTQDTKEWLKLVKQFDHPSSTFKIFEGVLRKRNYVVVKVGDEHILQEEYIMCETIHNAHIPNFITMYCLIQCKNDLSNVKPGSSVCSKTSDKSIGGLIMPWYRLGEIQKYAWNRNNFPVLQNVIKHVCCSMLLAYQTIGFVHRDFHLGNILLRHSTKKEILYEDISVPVNNILPVIMDFDKSGLLKENVKSFMLYEDIIKFIGLLRTELKEVVLDVSSIENILRTYETTKTPITSAVYRNICKNIDGISIRYTLAERNEQFKKLFKK